MPPAGNKGTKVVIAGAGIAGMTAALYLLDAGFDVTILEKEQVVGGKFGADLSGHEHAYHFLGDWCANLWAVGEKIGLGDRHLQRSHGVSFLRPRAVGGSLVSRLSTLRLEELGTLFSENLYSGVIPPDDMMIWFYSLLELVSYGRDLNEKEFLNRISVNGFMRSLSYMTDLAALLHQEALMKAFSIPSYETSVRSYRKFARFFSRDQDGRILARRVDQDFWRLFRRAVLDSGGKLKLGMELDSVEVRPSAGRHSKVVRFTVGRQQGKPETYEPVSHLLIAVPYPDLVEIVERSPSLRHEAPGLLELRKLRSRQMASLDLSFRRPLAGIPREHVTLIDDSAFRKAPRRESTRRSTVERKRVLATGGNRIASRFALSFIDNFQAWNNGSTKKTWLNVVAADFEELADLSPEEAQTAMLEELGKYIDLKAGGLDEEQTNLRRNADVPLFTNTVGSWQYRPVAGLYTDSVSFTQFDNLFLAGDYCKTDVDLVCLEGAVLAARMAAHAIAVKARRPKAELKAIEGLKPAEVSDEQVKRLMKDLEPWLRLAVRRGFGASAQAQHLSEWRRVVNQALRAV